MPGNVFISYRREDTAGYAGRLYDRLKASFPGRVFIDVGEIPPGADFVKAIEQHIEGCAALIALIGNNWTAQERLQDSADFVRLEISSALKRDTTVIPVLVGAAKLPSAATLPEDIQPLLRRQTISITDEDWDHGCERLIQALETVLGPASKRSNKARRWSIALAAAAVIVVLSLGLVWKTRYASFAANSTQAVPTNRGDVSTSPQGSSAANTTQASPTKLPETTRAAAEYDKSVAKSYDNAAQVMGDVANKIGGAGKALGPTITAISPNHATPGAVVTITGTNFGESQGPSTVKFGSLPARVRSWSSTSITVEAPTGSYGFPKVVVYVSSAGMSATGHIMMPPPPPPR